MADDIAEINDIVSISDALVINIGTLNERTIASMLAAGKKANELGRPVVLDPVGAGASKLRNETAHTLLKEVSFAVIRGNISEIKFLATGFGNTQGVDADSSEAVNEGNLEGVVAVAKSFAKASGAVIAITGATDIVADSESAYVISNGHPMMSNVTGTGCMLTTVIGSYVGANPKNILQATATAVVAMGVCGELAYKKVREQDAGTSTYKMHIIDEMSKVNADTLKVGAKIERK
jgi:hydroxyethylthiazole kinase